MGTVEVMGEMRNRRIRSVEVCVVLDGIDSSKEYNERQGGKSRLQHVYLERHRGGTRMWIVLST